MERRFLFPSQPFTKAAVAELSGTGTFDIQKQEGVNDPPRCRMMDYSFFGDGLITPSGLMNSGFFSQVMSDVLTLVFCKHTLE